MKTFYWMLGTVAFVIIAFLFMNGCFDKKKVITQIANGIKQEKTGDTGTHWRDLYNQEHDRNKALQEDRETANILHENELDQASKELQVNRNQITGLTDVVAKLEAKLKAKVDTTRRGDTTATSSSKGEFTQVTTATVGNIETIGIKSYVPIKLRQYWERPHHFLFIKYGDPVNYIDGTTRNPDVTLDSLNDVQILAKKPGRWGAGPSVGIFTSGTQWNWGIGISIHYSFIRW